MPTAEERRAAKEAKRQANREAWARDSRNANVQVAEVREVAVPIPAEPPTSAETGSLGRLRAIMADTEAPLFRRLDAAEVVLSYELAPASLVDAAVDADQVAAASFRFLRAVAEAPETPDQLRFRALKSLAAIENARAGRTSGSSSRERRELMVRLVNAERSQALREAGVWARVVENGAEWALHLSDEFEMPTLPDIPGFHSSPADGVRTIMERLQALPQDVLDRDREATRAVLMSVKASNRPETSGSG